MGLAGGVEAEWNTEVLPALAADVVASQVDAVRPRICLRGTVGKVPPTVQPDFGST